MLVENPDAKIYRFVIVRVIRVYDLGIEIEQACHAATFVSKAILRVTYQVVHSWRITGGQLELSSLTSYSLLLTAVDFHYNLPNYAI